MQIRLSIKYPMRVVLSIKTPDSPLGEFGKWHPGVAGLKHHGALMHQIPLMTGSSWPERLNGRNFLL